MAEVGGILGSIDRQVAQLIALESKPVTNLKTKKGDIEVIRGIFSDISSKLSKLRASAQMLADIVSSVFQAKIATSSDTKILTATASSTASAATHTISSHSVAGKVQLAQAHAVTSAGFSKTATTISTALGAGTFTFNITVGKGSVTPVTKTISVTIAAGDTNDTVLKNAASAINSSGLGASASVITTDVSGTEKLVITSNKTGTDNTVTDIVDVTGTLANSQLTIGRPGAFTDANANGIDDTVDGKTTQSAQDAKFRLDGNDITSSSNLVSTALTGVTINLLNETTTPVTVSVAADIDGIKAKVESFLNDFNDVIKFLKSKTDVDPVTKKRAALTGDIVFADLRPDLRNILATKITGHTATGNPNFLSEVGITAANDGTLSITDTSKFTDALKSDPKKVSDLFFDPNFNKSTAVLVDGVPTTGGIANKLDMFIESFVKADGIIKKNQKVMDDRITEINRQITRIEERLKIRETVLRKQLTAIFEVLARLSPQQQAITNFSKSLIG